MTEPSEKTGLLPCPICGGEAKTLSNGTWADCKDCGFPEAACLTVREWNCVPRRSTAIAEVVAEMRETVDDTNIYNGGNLKRRMSVWADRLRILKHIPAWKAERLEILQLLLDHIFGIQVGNTVAHPLEHAPERRD